MLQTFVRMQAEVDTAVLDVLHCPLVQAKALIIQVVSEVPNIKTFRTLVPEDVHISPCVGNCLGLSEKLGYLKHLQF